MTSNSSISASRVLGLQECTLYPAVLAILRVTWQDPLSHSLRMTLAWNGELELHSEEAPCWVRKALGSHDLPSSERRIESWTHFPDSFCESLE